MKNFLNSLFGVLVGAFLALGALAFAVPTSLPLPSIPGPFLGDFGNNLYTLTQAYGQGQGHFATSALSVSQTSGQANCTQLGDDVFQQIGTSAGAGYVCLPRSAPGKLLFVLNGTAQTITFYGFGSTSDTINTGSSYAGLTSGKLAVCTVAVAGKWQCGSIN